VLTPSLTQSGPLSEMIVSADRGQRDRRPGTEAAISPRPDAIRENGDSGCRHRKSPAILGNAGLNSGGLLANLIWPYKRWALPDPQLRRSSTHFPEILLGPIQPRIYADGASKNATPSSPVNTRTPHHVSESFTRSLPPNRHAQRSPTTRHLALVVSVRGPDSHPSLSRARAAPQPPILATSEEASQ
jgi:hypothetical protein